MARRRYDPPAGTGRTYAKVEGALSVPSWLAAVKAGRTFATNGPLLRFDVNGRGPGDELRVNGAAAVRVRAAVQSIAPLDRLEIIVNGEVAASAPANGRGTLEIAADVAITAITRTATGVAVKVRNPSAYVRQVTNGSVQITSVSGGNPLTLPLRGFRLLPGTDTTVEVPVRDNLNPGPANVLAVVDYGAEELLTGEQRLTF